MPTIARHITLFRRSTAGPWWADISLSGTRVRQSLGTRDRDEAEARAEQLWDATWAALGRAGRGEGVGLTTLQAHDLSRADAEGVTPAQRRSIADCWGHLIRLLGLELDPEALTYGDVQRYVAARRREGVRGQSIRKEVQALKRGLVAARRAGEIGRVLDDWPKIRSDAPRMAQAGKLFEVGEVLKWLEALATINEPAWLLYEVAMRTSLRAEELRRLTWGWLEAAPLGTDMHALLRVPAAAAKNRRERVVGVPAETLTLLERARTGRGLDEPLFPRADYRKSLANAARRAGLSRPPTLRDLRHTHATVAAQATGDAAGVQAALGHRDLAMTQRYMSATIARAAGAAMAVRAVLTRVGEQVGEADTVAEDRHGGPSQGLESGRGNRIRTCDPLLPKRVSEFLAHAEGCAHCLRLFVDALDVALDADECWHSARHRLVARSA